MLRLEPLETRALLSVSEISAPTAAFVSEYASGSPSEAAPISLAELDAEMGSDLEPSQTTSVDVSTPTIPLDVNFTLDGELLYDQGITDIKAQGIGSFDVYVNDEPYALNVGDFYRELPVGTKFEIKNINLNEGYVFQGVSSQPSWSDYGIAVGSLSGTIKEIESGPNEILISLATAPGEPEPLTTPTNPRLTAKTDTSISVAWDAVPNASRYRFVWRDKNDSSYTYVSLGASATSFTLEGLETGACYYWKVQAIGDKVSYFNSAFCATQTVKLGETVQLAAPVPVGATATATAITALWNAVPNASGYRFVYKTKTDSPYAYVSLDASTTSYSLTVSEEDTVYQWKVQAIGDKSSYLNSAFCATQTVKTSEPVQLVAPVPTDATTWSTSITASWNAVPNANGYRFVWKKKNDSSYTYATLGASTTSFTLTGLEKGATYLWKVQATGDKVSYLNSAFCATQTAKLVKTFDPEVTFSIEAGANVVNQTLELYAPEGCEIYYTTDGSDPVVSPENLYSDPLALSANVSRFAAESNLINIGDRRIYANNDLPKAVTVKAIAVTPDGVASPIETRTYFFQEIEPIAVISISTDYDNLLDYNTGIMVKGACYDAWINTPEAEPIIANKEWWNYQGNYTQKGKDWERPATIEIFDGDSYVVENCGIRLRGGNSRTYAQKPFNIYFRKEYGAKTLDYALFDDAESIDGEVLSSYKDFMLRNGGNDTEYLKFHDALIQSLVKDLNFATQADRPAVLYLNGEYMGVYVMQEKFSDRFFADHYLVDKDNVVIIEEGVVDEGKDADIVLYEELQSYADMDITDPEVYNAFCNVVDVESMIDYYATEIYIANADWNPTKNTRLWRIRTPENDSFGDGKWRWILYDTEYSSSLYQQAKTSYNYDSFAVALEVDPLFASVMKNSEFCNAFAERIEYLATNNFSTANVNAALESFSSVYKPYMADYYKRFGDTSGYWNVNINGIRNFFANRAGYILNVVENYRNLQFPEPVVPEVTFSIEAGSNVENQTLELFAPEGCDIYYTTDGSDPVVSPENLYSEPLALTANASRLAAESNNINIGNFRIYDNSELPQAVTVKAVAVTPDGAASPIETRTYFFQEKESVAVISISTDYDNLLDYDTGIMVKGAYYDAWIQTPEAADIIANGKIWKYQGNYTQKGKDWERPATLEIFDGENYVVENCGIRLRGDASRMYSQKSFAFYFTEDYGVNGLDYAFFEDATTIDGNVLSSYKDFIVRNGGNDTQYLKFHDALIQSLAKDLNIATQASRPAVLYLNGEYMGVYVAQERYDARFFADHYLVDKDDVVVAQEGAVAGGEDADVALYEELLSYADMDMTDPEVYNAFRNVVDIESMIDYYATEIYIANADWNSSKNVCLWRTRTSENDSFGDGKWRWALYDTEFSSSLYNRTETSYNYDSFTAALNADPLFASVMKNAEFCDAFAERIESLAENNFSSTNVESALASFAALYQPYMSNYYKRFGDTSWAWNSNMDGIRNFFANRAGYILSFVENYQQ